MCLISSLFNHEMNYSMAVNAEIENDVLLEATAPELGGLDLHAGNRWRTRSLVDPDGPTPELNTATIL